MTVAPELDAPYSFNDRTRPVDVSVSPVPRAREAFITPRVEALGNGLTFVSFQDGDPIFSELSEEIATMRQTRFKEEGLLLSSAPDKDSIRGENVEILAILDKDMRPVASLRKWHAMPGQGIETLPSYQKAVKEEGGLTEEGLALISERVIGKHPVEIGALYKEPEYGSFVKDILYREAFHDAVERNEIWLMGVVTREYNNLRRTFGGLVYDIGNPFPVRGEDASENVRLHPIIMDQSTFVGDMVGEIREARRRGDIVTELAREATLWYFLDGVRGSKLAAVALGSLMETENA